MCIHCSFRKELSLGSGRAEKGGFGSLMPTLQTNVFFKKQCIVQDVPWDPQLPPSPQNSLLKYSIQLNRILSWEFFWQVQLPPTHSIYSGVLTCFVGKHSLAGTCLARKGAQSQGAVMNGRWQSSTVRQNSSEGCCGGQNDVCLTKMSMFLPRPMDVTVHSQRNFIQVSDLKILR